MMGIFAVVVALLGLALGQPWEYGYPCSIANCAGHCMTNVTKNHIACDAYDWGCLCFSDTFLHYIEACALDNCTKLEYSGAFCEVAKSCLSVNAPMTFGPYSTAVTIDDPRTYPTLWTEDLPATVQADSLTTPDSVISTSVQSVARTMTSFNSTPSMVAITVTLPPDDGPESPPSSANWTTFATSQESAIASSNEVSTGPPSSVTSATPTTSATNPDLGTASSHEVPPVPSTSLPTGSLTTSLETESVDPPSNVGNPTALPASVNSIASDSAPRHGNMTSPPAASDTIAGPNATFTEPPVSNSTVSTAPTLSKSPHKSSESPPITSLLSGTASGLVTDPDETGADHDSSSRSTTRSTLTVSAATTTVTSTEGGAVTVGQSVCGVAFGALIAVGVLMLGL